MGGLFSIPIKTSPMSFADKEHFSATGETQSQSGNRSVVIVTINDDGQPANTFEEITVNLFQNILEMRLCCVEAKEKFRNVDMAAINARFPQWTIHEILDLKAQFQTFDLNHDALIDFTELCCVLDELGDTSSQEDRLLYFETIDEDGSGAVDFEEFVTLIDAVISGRSKLSKMDTVGLAIQSGSENAPKLRRLSVIQQIDVGLF